MKVLIICPVIFPDSVIAAVRPSMFAKYLSSFGHNVTILRSGEVSKMVSKLDEDRPYRVISYLGYNCDAERYERGEIIPKRNAVTSKTSKKQKSIHKKLYDIKHSIEEPISIFKDIRKAKSNFFLQKGALEKIKHDHFDIVFSTYSPLEDVYAGEYAAKLFNCKWIMDFRDLLVQTTTRSWLRNQVFGFIQKRAVKNASLCTAISEGLATNLKKCVQNSNVVTLYNGYEPSKSDASCSESNRVLSICYTGNVYSRRGEALQELLRAFQFLSKNNLIDQRNLKIKYAGDQSDKLRQMLAGYGLDIEIEDNGFLSPKETDALQQNSDIFLVLSWNTKQDQGILTGKFFEGIRAKKPMLAMVVGDTPYCELWQLNEKYHYGFCYEKVVGEESFKQLCDFLIRLYNEKTNTGKINYIQSKTFEEDFRYENLSRQLESICLNLIK